MKALSIRQPWAHLIASGYKDIENRSRRTHYRGEFLIHAGMSYDPDYKRDERSFIDVLVRSGCFDSHAAARRALRHIDIGMGWPRGGIIGKATLVDCVERSNSPWYAWFEGDYGYVIENAVLFDCVYGCKGSLGWFNVDVDNRGLPKLPAGRWINPPLTKWKALYGVREDVASERMITDGHERHIAYTGGYEDACITMMRDSYPYPYAPRHHRYCGGKTREEALINLAEVNGWPLWKGAQAK